MANEAFLHNQELTQEVETLRAENIRLKVELDQVRLGHRLYLYSEEEEEA